MLAVLQASPTSAAGECSALVTALLRAAGTGQWNELYDLDPMDSPHGRHAQAVRCLLRALAAAHKRFHGEPQALGRLAAALSGQVVSAVQAPTSAIPLNLRPWQQVIEHLRRMEVGSLLPTWQTCDAIAALHDHLAGRDHRVVDLYARHQISESVIAGLLASAGVYRA